jgi:thioesterase domain-containing protein
MSQSVSLNHAQPDAADLVAAARHLGAMIRATPEHGPYRLAD